MPIPLPIDALLPEIVSAVRRHRALVVTAAPGAGKTTRVPPALADDGPVMVLQPRRVAARAMAARVAEERGWRLGQEVGWHVRLDRRCTDDTRVLFATEGVLTARLLQDPLLSTVRTLVIDEFHERSIHADVGIALAKQAWMARDDLRLVVMSATIDADRVAQYLGDAPVIVVPGRTFPIDVRHAPGQSLDQVVAEALSGADGAVLAFLPGAGEIQRAMTAVQSRLSVQRIDADVLPLYGGLSMEAQDAALQPSSRPRVILSTNVAETTITVPDVTAVIDTGVHKVARYDAERGVDRLVTERISQDSADQRAGRAGRVRAGRVWRLWDARDRLRPHREAEILRIDLAATALDVIAWGGDPFTPGAFDWFEAPPAYALDAARVLLRQLGALDDRGRLTTLGRELRRVPAHPRLARLLIADGASARAARAVALLSEGARASGVATSRASAPCDVLVAVDDRAFPPHLRDVARALQSSAAGSRHIEPGPDTEARFRRAVFAAYPDRLARRRDATGDRFALASGTGARLSRESVVHHAEFVTAVEVRHIGNLKPTSAADEPLITMASAVDPEWITPTSTETVHEYDHDARKVRAHRVERYGALTLRSHAVAPDAEAVSAILFGVWQRRERTDDERELLARLRFAGTEPFASVLAEIEATGEAAPSSHEWRITAERGGDPTLALSSSLLSRLERVAPAALTVPSGRSRALSYREDGSVFAAVKLQELFGLAETPKIGPRQVPVTFELLAPNGRPVQVTRDLKSFWTCGYPEVRKELRGRYPRHPWPDDPWTATPTARTKRT
mgnify:CR=1 FL=1